MKTHRKCRGFTLVELLVVMSIIAMLVALLLPAVNAARESSRGVVCANNLRQFGIGMHEHASRHGTYCTGAWNWSEDGCVTEKGWVADLVNSGIPVGEMRCPSNPTQVSEVFNQLLTLAPAPTDNCTNYAGTPGKTLPSGALLLNVCRNIINNNVAPLSRNRKFRIDQSSGCFAVVQNQITLRIKYFVQRLARSPVSLTCRRAPN